MTRSLLIRQVFVFIDLALALGVVLTVAYAAFHFFDAPPSAALSAGAGNDDVPKPTAIASVGGRPAYDFISSSGLFGDAGRWSPGEKAEAATQAGEGEGEGEKPTELNLRLVGTSAPSGKDPLATAIIEDQDQNTTFTYGLGDTIADNVTLKAVRQREVVLWNQRETPARQELLSMDEKKEPAPDANAGAAPTAVSDGKTQRITLNRNEMMQSLMTGYGDLIAKVKPEMYRDATGKVVGVTANNIGEIPLTKKLGLQNNDVLQTVNNETIDSEQKIMELVNKYRNAGSFRIGILRGGAPQTITYRLE